MNIVFAGQRSRILEAVDDPDNPYAMVRGSKGHVHHLRLFRRKAELFGSLDHPNIVKPIGVVRDGHGDITAMVMELASGTLKGVCGMPGGLHAAGATGDAAMEALRGIMLGAARALQYLHAQAPPVYCRDIKPGNLLLFQDEHGRVISAKLGDFGEGKVVCWCASSLSLACGGFVGSPCARHLSQCPSTHGSVCASGVAVPEHPWKRVREWCGALRCVCVLWAFTEGL